MKNTLKNIYFKVLKSPEESGDDNDEAPVPEEPQNFQGKSLKNIDDTSSEEGVRDAALPVGDDDGLKKSHYLERRSSSESSSEFSLGPRVGKVQPSPAAPVPGNFCPVYTLIQTLFYHLK